MTTSFEDNPLSSSIDSDELVALRAIVAGTAHSTGNDFFQNLVSHLAKAINVQNAFIAEFTVNPTRVRTLAFWSNGHLAENIEYDLRGTPCQDVVRGQLCHHPIGVAQAFPLDLALTELKIESYLGVPLTNPQNEVLGHLAVFDSRPMPQEPKRMFTFRIFAARAAAELQRARLEHKLQASEKRYRDLFEEAPIPYVYEDTQTRFVSANHAFINLLGLKPDEVAGTVGMSLVAKDPANLAPLEGAFSDIRHGQERGLGMLELRRKDNGQPVWVQFWSRPEPDGEHTRTMIIDITARVLAEREKIRLQSQNDYLKEEIKAAVNFEEIVGRSSALKSVLENIRAVAPTDASVLITGETGTGKELIARAIHSVSRRADKPLIKVNCAALPAGLIESELFGHEKGAFTGAINKRLGRFELAHGGTIFLDEIGELPLEMQSKLLRVLQEREIERIGGQGTIHVDVRIIAATNRDLEQASRDREFREDLFYRLNVFPIHIPPLRQRTEDIPLLANYFADKFAVQFGKKIQGIEQSTLERLVKYPWPGNIRELQNVIERAAILSNNHQITIGCDILKIPAQHDEITDDREFTVATDFKQTTQSLDELERDHILHVLEQVGWRIDGNRGAAKILGVNPNTLRSRMKKFGIERPQKI